MHARIVRTVSLTLAMTAVGAGAGVVGWSSLATAQNPSIAARAEAIGPRLGTRLPTGLSVVDGSGRAIKLSRVAGRNGMLIVLFRSAAWCPYCKAQLKDLKDVAATARANRVTLVGISYDSPDVLAGFAKAQALNFALYSDTSSRVIDRLGLRDPSYDKASFAYGVPHPTILRVGADGVVKAKSVELDYRVRPSKADIAAMIALK